MKFYDYHVHPEIDLEKMLELGKLLGWSGLCFVCKNPGEIENIKKILNKNFGLDVAFGYKIEGKKPGDIKKLAKSVRKKVELVLVFGGNLEVNRKAVETPEVDILTHPELGRNDSGLDHVMAKLAKENNVAIEFNFRELLHSYKKSRADLFSRLLKNAKLISKYKTPFILTSGALDPWDMRPPSELISFGRLLGFRDPEIKKALSDGLIIENRKRLGGKWIMPGVEVE